MVLEVYTGPMFSGKTTKMISRLSTLHDVYSLKVLVVNHVFDNRDLDKFVSSHSCAYSGLPMSFEKKSVEKLSDLSEDLLSGFSIIGIDECNFFPDLVDFVKERYLSKHIICSGLDSDFQQALFGQIHLLLPYATVFKKLTAVCTHCYGPASFTRRLSSQKEKVLVGGKNTYEPVCTKCLLHFRDI